MLFVVSVTEIWGLLGLRLADDSIIPFNYLSYAEQLQVYLSSIAKHTCIIIVYLIFPYFGQVYNDKLFNLLDKQISLNPLNASIQEFASAAKEANVESNVNETAMNSSVLGIIYDLNLT